MNEAIQPPQSDQTSQQPPVVQPPQTHSSLEGGNTVAPDISELIGRSQVQPETPSHQEGANATAQSPRKIFGGESVFKNLRRGTVPHSEMAERSLAEGKQLCESLSSEQVNLPDEEIAALGELCAGMFFAPVHKGKLIVPSEYKDTNNVALAVLEPGDYSLDRSFFNPTPQQAEAAAKVIEEDWQLRYTKVPGSKIVTNEFFDPLKKPVNFHIDDALLGTVVDNNSLLYESDYREDKHLNGVGLIYGRPLMVMVTQPVRPQLFMDVWFHELTHVKQKMETGATTVPDAKAVAPEREMEAYRVGGIVGQLVKQNGGDLSKTGEAQIKIEEIRRRHARHPDDFELTEPLREDLRQNGVLGYPYAARYMKKR